MNLVAASALEKFNSNERPRRTGIYGLVNTVIGPTRMNGRDWRLNVELDGMDEQDNVSVSVRIWVKPRDLVLIPAMTPGDFIIITQAEYLSDTIRNRLIYQIGSDKFTRISIIIVKKAQFRKILENEKSIKNGEKSWYHYCHHSSLLKRAKLTSRQQKLYKSSCWNKPPTGLAAKEKWTAKYISIFSNEELSTLNSAFEKLIKMEPHKTIMDGYYYYGIVGRAYKFIMSDNDEIQIMMLVKLKDTNDQVANTNWEAADQKFHHYCSEVAKSKNSGGQKLLKKVITYDGPEQLLDGNLNLGKGHYMIITAEGSCIAILDQLKLNPYMEINIISDSSLKDGRLDSFDINISDYSNYMWICPNSTAENLAETFNKED